MSETSNRADSDETESPPQKLLLAPLLENAASGGAAGAAGAAAAAAVATAAAVGNFVAFTKTSRPAESQSSAPKGDKLEGSNNGRRSWWQITEADSDEETACHSTASAPSDAATDARSVEQTAVEQMRHRLLITARLLNELQVENTSLCEALKRSREQWAVGADEAILLKKDRDALRRDNEALRTELEEMRRRCQAEEHAWEQNEKIRCADIEARAAEAEEQIEQLKSFATAREARVEKLQAAVDASRIESARAQAELHKAQVALVSIVPELERRIDCKGAALEAAEQRVRALQAQLEERRANQGSACPSSALVSPAVTVARKNDAKNT